MANIRSGFWPFMAVVFFFFSIVSDGQTGQTPLPFSIQVRVEKSRVIFIVMNHGPDVVLRENVAVEHWDQTSRSWRFAASPLWVCASKETVFAKPLAAGEQITIIWNRSLHKECRKAAPGRYQVLIRDRQGSLQSQPAEFDIPVEVEISLNPEYRETIYRTSQGACTLSWVLPDSNLNPVTVLHRSSCSLSLTEQSPLMAALLEAVLRSGTFPQSEWTLFWGRLSPNHPLCCELSQRLMLAAHLSKEWDSRRGKPRQGHENTFVHQISEQAGIFPELFEMLQTRGLELSVSSVEKVLVCKAKDSPCYVNLKSLGVGPEEKLPFDCQIWFRVRPKSIP